MISRNQAITLGLITLAVAAVVTAAVVYYALRVRGTGKIKLIGLKAYSDVDLTKEVSAIDWGVLSPDATGEVTLYLKSTSTVPSNLTLSTENYDPLEFEQYSTLTWDYDGTPLAVGASRAVKFTIHISPDIVNITDFAFDIVITAFG